MKEKHYAGQTGRGLFDLLTTWIYRLISSMGIYSYMGIYTVFPQIFFPKIFRKSLSKTIIFVGRAGPILQKEKFETAS